MKWLAAIAWLVFILFFSLRPSLELSLYSFPASDKIFHFFSYAVWQYLFFIAVKDRYSLKLLTLLLIVNISIGGLVEILQAVMQNGRTAEWLDFFVNLFAALLVYFFTFRKV